MFIFLIVLNLKYMLFLRCHVTHWLCAAYLRTLYCELLSSSWKKTDRYRATMRMQPFPEVKNSFARFIHNSRLKWDFPSFMRHVCVTGLKQLNVTRKSHESTRWVRVKSRVFTIMNFLLTVWESRSVSILFLSTIALCRVRDSFSYNAGAIHDWASSSPLISLRSLSREASL